MKRTKKSVAKTEKVELTVKDGKRTHDRTITISSKRLFDRDTFGIAQMLKRWGSNKPSSDSSVVLLLTTQNVRVRKSDHVHRMAHNLRQALRGANCAPA